MYESLRAKLIEILGEELGAYTFANKQSVPAIAVASNRPYPQPGTTITGLEVVIYPQIGTAAQFMLGSTLLVHETRLVLNQWNLDKDTLKARDLLVSNLSIILERIGPRVLADGNAQTIESQTFYLKESNIIRWFR